VIEPKQSSTQAPQIRQNNRFLNFRISLDRTSLSFLHRFMSFRRSPPYQNWCY